MKKSAAALVSLALVVAMAPPAFAAPPLESSPVVAQSRNLAAVEPGEDYSSGALFDENQKPGCYENQLGGGEPWSTVSAERVDLPFAMRDGDAYWTDIWISPQGALSHDPGFGATGMDVAGQDLIRSSEVYAPMLAGNSATSWWNQDDPFSPDFGQHLTQVYYGTSSFDGKTALCVTWLDAVPQVPVGSPEWVVNEWYPAGGYWTQEFDWDPSRRNSFQVLLVDRSDTGSGDYDIVYNYDTIQWQVDSGWISPDTGDLEYMYADAGWSRGIGVSPCDTEFCWRGYVEGQVGDEGEVVNYPQAPYPNDHWFPQHDGLGQRDTYLDSSPTGLAVTSTPPDGRVGRHIFPIRYAGGPRWHLALVLDGSASLTPEEYAAEIDAIVAGLDDVEAFPRDGRFGISVTVVGGYVDPATGGDVDAVMLFPESTIASDAAMEALQTWIRAIPQSTIERGSDAAGLRVAVNDTDSFGSRDALRSVCQVTFTLPSSELRGDLSGYRASGAVDRVDLIGVGGAVGGNTGSSWDESLVRDRLFGGNRYLYVPSAAELAEEWVGHCTERFPLIRGMEVNQGIQNLENEVPLVAGRQAVVRVYAEEVFHDDPAWRLSGTLEGWDTDNDDVAWYGGYPPINDDPIDLSMDFGNPETRTNLGGKLGRERVIEFYVHPDYAHGNLVLHFESNQPNPDSWMSGRTGVTCTWATPSYLEPCDIEVSFLDTDPFYVNVYRMAAGTDAPTWDDAQEQVARLYSQLPVSYDGFEARTTTEVIPAPPVITWPEGADVFFTWLAAWNARTFDTAASAASGEPVPYYHWLFKGTGRRGMGVPFSGVSMSDIKSGRNEHEVGATGPRRNDIVHEIGHAIGLNHDRALPIYANGIGYCGEEFPWDTGLGTGVKLPWSSFRVPFVDGEPSADIRIPTISDFAARAEEPDVMSAEPATIYSEFWGVDHRHAGIRGDEHLAYSDPRITGELMSYANSFVHPGEEECLLDTERVGQGVWVSPDSYIYFMNRLSPDTVMNRLSLEGEDVPVEGNMVMGSIVFGRDGATVEFGPVLEVSNMGTERTNDVDIVLDLFDASGTLLGTVTPDIVTPVNEGSDADGTEFAAFVAGFTQEGVARIDLVRSGVVLGSTTASASTPVVEITNPVTDSSVTGDEVLLEWTASDADGDPLTFMVVYSSDGLEWTTLEAHITGNSVVFDRSRITGSDAGQFMVIVDDGFNSSSDTVGGLAVEGSAPWAAISTPAEGQEFLASEQLVFLGWASDPEDGSFPLAELTWESSLDGVLDTTEQVRARDLTAGVHVITLSVTDSDGNVATDTSTVTILPEVSPVVEWLVSFDSQGGSGVDGVVVTDGGGITPPADPTRVDYVFDGWFTQADGGTPWDFATAPVVADVTLFAHWTFVPGLLSDVNATLADLQGVADGHFASAISTLAAAAVEGLWHSQNTPTDVPLVVSNLYGSRSALMCTAPFETAETGETALIARIDGVVGVLDPEGAAAPSGWSSSTWASVGNVGSVMTALRAIVRGESPRYLVEAARDVLAASTDPHFLVAADRLNSALAPVHWKNSKEPAKGDSTVRQTLTDVRNLVRCDVEGPAEQTTARDARRYIETAVLIALWGQIRR